MIAVVAEIRVKDGKVEEYLAQAEKVVEGTRKEEGCIYYDCCRSADDPLGFAMVEKWKDKDALDAHMQTDHFKEFKSATEDLTAGPSAINLYSVLI